MITFQQHFMTGYDRFDTDLRDLEIIETEAGVFLYASTGSNGGLSLFRLTQSSGALVLQDRHWHQNATLATGEFSLAQIGGETHLLQQETSGSNLLSYQVSTSGSLGSQMTEPLSTTGSAGSSVGGLDLLASATLGAGQSVVYGVSETGVLTGWRMDAAGAAQGEITRAGAATSYQLSEAAAITVSQDGGWLFVADQQGLHSYLIDAQSGDLQLADHMGVAQGLPVADPSALQSFQAHGASWVVMAAAGTGSLSLFQVAPTGELLLRDQLNDTLATRFGGASVLEVVVLETGHVLLLAAGADDGLSLLQLLPSGQMLHLQSFAHETGLGLENVSALETFVNGDQLELYVSSAAAAGISHFSLDLSDLGMLATAAQGALAGGSGDDLLQGGAGAVQLAGQAGDDILVVQGAGSEMTGGGGADRFVVAALSGQVVIRDFRPGEDSLDLSLIPGLYGPGQLQQSMRSDGILLSFGTLEIRLISASGAALELADIWPEGQFAIPDRLVIAPLADTGIQYGTGADDQLQGGNGDDSLQGLGGNDQLQGGNGADLLQGDEGNDSLFGGAGADLLYGNDGVDLLLGGSGNDTIYGGGGDDHVKGNSGADQIHGGAGDDTLKGYSGHDRIYGGSGDDLVKGYNGHDRLFGGAGDDWIRGFIGFDRLYGGTGNDRLEGGSGRDQLFGGAGHDSLFGGSWNDRLSGGSGHDRLYGNSGADTLDGGAGNDRLSGGTGNDSLTGGAGEDVFVFAQGLGRDRISDFTAGEDQINLLWMAGQGKGFADLNILQVEEGALVLTGSGRILLEDVLANSLSADDFLF